MLVALALSKDASIYNTGRRLNTECYRTFN